MLAPVVELANKESRILLVDDQPDITITFKITLESAGFIVHTYHSPLVALSKFKPSYYDLVILDIKMKEMSGFELYSEIRKVDNQAGFCFITAGELHYDEIGKEEEKLCCKLDAEQFLRKPISNDDLVKGISKIMMSNKSLDIPQNI